MFFKKLQDQQPKKPQLLGEDFDIYPDLGDRPKPASPTEAEEASEPEEPDIIEPTDFEKRFRLPLEFYWDFCARCV